VSKVAHYLQEHLLGEVMTSADALDYFATDGSVLTLRPSIIMYPRSENDVRKAARFTWQLAERGRVLSITARGSGTDQGGAALGSGLIIAFPAHLNRIVTLDVKEGLVTVEPGINFGKLQQTLMTHGRFIPAYPASLEYSTIGGAVANNASGERSLKYGDMRTFVHSLKVVLANGEVIQTGRLNRRELNKKLGLTTFEGEVYRALDALLEEQRDVLKDLERNVTKNTAGYNLLEVKTKEGFDLTPLFAGSQGTLGIITEITLETEGFNPATTLIVSMFDSAESVQAAVTELRALSDMPCAIEMVDDKLLEMVEQLNPNQLRDVISKPYPKQVLLVEFDDANEHTQKRMAKKALKILEKHATSRQVAANEAEQTQILKLRQATATLLAHSDGTARAVPFVDDGIVPLDKYAEFVDKLYELLEADHVPAAVWGHAGDANLHVQPHLDLAHVGDRQKLFRLLDDYYNMVIALGGSISGEHGDGRLRAAYLPKLYGDDAYSLLQKVKKIFDPYGTLNPGVKIDVTIDDVKPLLRHEYNLGAWYDHMPRL
jgi:FAD/FMN-containing dehydrogenase